MYPKAYIEFLVHFHGDRDYFECHEILEEYRKKSTQEDKDSVWVGLILLAVSNYHYRRENFSGAYRTLSKSISIFQRNLQVSKFLGINFYELVYFLKERLLKIDLNVPYSSFSLPFTDAQLLKDCQKRCGEKGYIWGEDSDLMNTELMNRHSLRDRTDVIRERAQAIAKRSHEKGRE